MRGFKARLLLAQARSMTQFGSAAAKLLGAATQAAVQEGMGDAARGVATMPAIYVGELLLSSAWLAGRRQYAKSLNKSSWHAHCETIAVQAESRCRSPAYFVHIFSAAIDRAVADLPAHQRDDSVSIAVQFGYATRETRALLSRETSGSRECPGRTTSKKAMRRRLNQLFRRLGNEAGWTLVSG
jgi:hypothetical protein